MDPRMEEESMAAKSDSKNDSVGPQSTLPQPTYKSYKKKFRKLKLKFEETLQHNKDLYFEEQRAIQTATRIAIENDRILDMLYDVNCSAQIPVEKRIDLSAETPILPPIPPLFSEDEVLKVSNLKTTEGKRLYEEISHIVGARESPKSSSPKPKSLAVLLKSIPHLDSNVPNLPPDVLSSLELEEGRSAPYTYLTPDQIDYYNYEIDASRGDVTAITRPPPHDIFQEPVFGNFHSPYNWLRRNVPQIFLQDGECSEKSNGKPGALRGAGKRASVPGLGKPDALDIVEEDGLGCDAALGGVKEKVKKRKREEDDIGSIPKKVAAEEIKVKKSRPSRKKKSDSHEEKPQSVRKGKNAKLPSPPPGAHPFGPA